MHLIYYISLIYLISFVRQKAKNCKKKQQRKLIIAKKKKSIKTTSNVQKIIQRDNVLKYY